MVQEFGYENDQLRLAIISYITSNPNSTLEQIFRGIPASHTKVRHWLQELTRSGIITPSAPIGSIPLQSILWSVAGGFSPLDVPNLIGWWDASDAATITKDGSDRVSQWDDKSGQDNHLTNAVSATQPLWVSAAQNGLDVIRFNGTDELIDRATYTGGALSQPFTWLIAFKNITNSPPTGVQLSTSTVFLHHQNSRYYYSGTNIDTGVTNTTNWEQEYAIFDSPNSILAVDGTEISTGNYNS
ncbi:MAG: hypothetical protein OEL84_00785 [Nitrosopumilus sp.]|nr:hypothetical protein [Nitrosopumilus sp.]